MSSFSDYVPGSATASYRQAVDKAAEIAEQQKRMVDPIHHEKIDRLLDTYTRKRQYFLDGLDRIGLKHNVPQGTYFVLIDIQDFLDLPRFKGWTDLEFCEWMIVNIGVAAVPGSSFFKEPVNHLIRLHFAREESTIDEALSRLSRLTELLK